VIVKHFQFEWDEVKAAKNVRKHGISFELAGTVFQDPRLVTTADLAHSEFENDGFQSVAQPMASWFQLPMSGWARIRRSQECV
jgi:hypothetical protein